MTPDILQTLKQPLDPRWLSAVHIFKNPLMPRYNLTLDGGTFAPWITLRSFMRNYPTAAGLRFIPSLIPYRGALKNHL